MKLMNNIRYALLAISLTGGFTFTYSQNVPDKEKLQERYFNITKNIEIFNSVLKEMDMEALANRSR